jgi:hypothetical protein
MYFASAILGNIDSKTFVSAQLLGTDGSSGATSSLEDVQEVMSKAVAKRNVEKVCVIFDS